MGYGQGYQIRIGPRITPIVKYLVIANAVVFLWTGLAGFMGGSEIIRIFGLTPSLVTRNLYLWQLVTYLFLHGGFFHILINMFFLWMFGAELENRWGSRQFLKYYFITGIGAGIVSILAEPFSNIPTIGASGAVYGILLAYGMIFPERYVYVYFLFPVKVKYLVGFLAVLAFLATLSSPGSTVAHIAHLGGMLVGFLYLKGWLTLSLIRKQYHEWRMRRLRSRFRVYEQKRKQSKKEDDFWIN
jgi:membrane associated rhomboid family serine protease